MREPAKRGRYEFALSVAHQFSRIVCREARFGLTGSLKVSDREYNARLEFSIQAQ